MFLRISSRTAGTDELSCAVSCELAKTFCSSKVSCKFRTLTLPLLDELAACVQSNASLPCRKSRTSSAAFDGSSCVAKDLLSCRKLFRPNRTRICRLFRLRASTSGDSATMFSTQTSIHKNRTRKRHVRGPLRAFSSCELSKSSLLTKLSCRPCTSSHCCCVLKPSVRC
jgi:hypothetical protein